MCCQEKSSWIPWPLLRCPSPTSWEVFRNAGFSMICFSSWNSTQRGGMCSGCSQTLGKPFPIFWIFFHKETSEFFPLLASLLLSCSWLELCPTIPIVPVLSKILSSPPSALPAPHLWNSSLSQISWPTSSDREVSQGLRNLG